MAKHIFKQSSIGSIVTETDFDGGRCRVWRWDQFRQGFVPILIDGVVHSGRKVMNKIASSLPAILVNTEIVTNGIQTAINLGNVNDLCTKCALRAACLDFIHSRTITIIKNNSDTALPAIYHEPLQEREVGS